MSTAAVEQQPPARGDSLVWLLEDDMTCAVCLDIFDDPCTLKCAHNFCEKCIKLLIRSQSVSNCLACPLCRVETSFNPTSFEGLNKNPTLKAKVENAQQKRSNKRERDAPDSATSHQNTKQAHVSVPRNIKLMEEYDAAIGKCTRTYIPQDHCGFIGYGLEEQREDNHELKHWHAMIIGPQESPIGQLIYNLTVTVPDTYPKEPPEVRFVSPKIRMPCVNKKGYVNLTLIEKIDMSLVDVGTGQVSESKGEFFSWHETLNIADILISIRENMHLESVSNDSADLPSTSYRDSSDDEEEEGEDE